MVKEKGPEFVQGAIPALRGNLVQVVKSGATETELEKAVVELGLVVVDRTLGIKDDELKKEPVCSNGLSRWNGPLRLSLTEHSGTQ
jgi:hypothetical protein